MWGFQIRKPHQNRMMRIPAHRQHVLTLPTNFSMPHGCCCKMHLTCAYQRHTAEFNLFYIRGWTTSKVYRPAYRWKGLDARNAVKQMKFITAHSRMSELAQKWESLLWNILARSEMSQLVPKWWSMSEISEFILKWACLLECVSFFRCEQVCSEMSQTAQNRCVFKKKQVC